MHGLDTGQEFADVRRILQEGRQHHWDIKKRKQDPLEKGNWAASRECVSTRVATSTPSGFIKTDLSATSPISMAHSLQEWKLYMSMASSCPPNAPVPRLSVVDIFWPWTPFALLLISLGSLFSIKRNFHGHIQNSNCETWGPDWYRHCHRVSLWIRFLLFSASTFSLALWARLVLERVKCVL